jgi:hypothetical protein
MFYVLGLRHTIDRLTVIQHIVKCYVYTVENEVNMADYIKIDDDHEQCRADSEVNKSRLFNKPELDEAIIGTVVNNSGKRVFLYHDEIVEDIYAKKFEEDDEITLDPDETYHNIAADHVSYHLDDYLYSKVPYAPIVVWEAIEELSEYEEEFQIYKLRDQYWIGNLFEWIDPPQTPDE